MKNIITFLIPVLLVLTSCAQEKKVNYKVNKTDAEWKKQLTQLQYEVTREEGTEAAFTGKYLDNHQVGIYKCVCCDQEVFASDNKFESGTGWPSFYQPINAINVGETTDKSFGMER